MPLHPHFADNLHLLEGMSSLEAVLTDPQLIPRLIRFMSGSEAMQAPEATIRDVQAAGPHGSVPIRVYSPLDGAGSSDVPALVWVHGGSFRLGSIDDPPTDALARQFCAGAGAVVITVEYRLAADGVHFPVPHDDIVAALRWVRSSAAELGIDPQRICAGGDSAGGNLAAGAVLRLRDEDAWTPAALLLAYPTLHPVLPPQASALVAAVAELPDLLRFFPHDVAEMTRNYVGGPESTAGGYAMPALAVLHGLPPTLVVNAEYDDLRASGEAFVAALALAGVDVQQVTARGMLHSFLMVPDSVEPGARIKRLFADWIRNAGQPASTDVAPFGLVPTTTRV